MNEKKLSIICVILYLTNMCKKYSKYVPNYKKIYRKGARSLYNNREKW